MVKIQPELSPLKDPHERVKKEMRTSSGKYVYQSKTKKIFAKLIFHPESPTRLAWDIIMLVLIIYQALTIPYFVCFNDDYTPLLNHLDISLTFVFFMDIFITFNTGFYHKGSLIMKRREITIEYLKFWFWIDLIATFPYNWFVEGFNVDKSSEDTTSSAPKVLKILRVFRFLRILRLLRLAKLKKILIKIEDFIASNTLANFFVFIRLLSMVFFIAHWTACFWFFIGYQESLTHPISWIISVDIKDKSNFEQYITSLYWAFTTIATVGYGDITPITLNEKLFTMMTMIMSSGVFAYTVGSIGSLISKQNASENSYREKVVAVNSYMKKKRLPKDLQFRVRRYLDYIWEVKKKQRLDEKQVLSLLSEPLRDEIYARINANLIKSCPVFKVAYESYFIAQLTRTIENETYAPGDVIFAEGEISSKIYFVMNGRIKIFHQATNSIFKELSSKDYFGEIAFFTGANRSASAKCVEFVDLLSLIRVNFLSLLEKFPEAQEYTQNIQKKCEGGNYTSLYINCYICEEVGHVAAKCKNFLINLDQEESKNNWLENRDGLKTVRINPHKFLPNYQRKGKKKTKGIYNGRNIVGRPTNGRIDRAVDLYPIVVEYMQNNSGSSTRATNKEN